MAWGVSGPFVVEIVWKDGRKHLVRVFDTQREAQTAAEEYRARGDVFSVAAWDLHGGWRE